MKKAARDDTLAEPLNPNKHYDEAGEGSSSAPARMTGSDGLTTEEAARLMEQWGPNSLPENKKSKVHAIRPPARRARHTRGHSNFPDARASPCLRSSCCCSRRSSRRWRC
jgi:hypothetical protein